MDGAILTLLFLFLPLKIEIEKNTNVVCSVERGERKRERERTPKGRRERTPKGRRERRIFISTHISRHPSLNLRFSALLPVPGGTRTLLLSLAKMFLTDFARTK